MSCLLAQSYNPEAIKQANLGVSLAKKQDYRGAVDAYQRALKIDSRLPHLCLNLGLAYFKQGKFREALAALNKEPRNAQVDTLTGMSYFGLGEYKQAAETLEPLAAAQPDNGELGYLLAKCYLWAGDSGHAAGLFRRLLERDPDSAPVHLLLAEALDAQDRESEAVQEFQAAIKVAPVQPEAHFGLGYLYWKQKRYHEAAQEFHAELASNPGHALSLAYSGDILLRGGRSDEAFAALRKAKDLDARLHVVHQDLGIYYQGKRDLEKAVQEFQLAVQTAPDNYDSHYRLARIYRESGRTKEAEKEFAVVRKLHEKAKEEPLMNISSPPRQ